MNDSRQGYQGGSHQYGNHQRYGMGQHPRHPQQMMPPLMQRSQSGGAPHVMGQHPPAYGRQTSAPPTAYGQRTMMMGDSGMPKSPERQVSFDMSRDFPSLGGEAPPSQTNTYANHAAQQRARFSLQNESFPALPGSGGDSSSSKSRNTAPKPTIPSAKSNSTTKTPAATTSTTSKTATSSGSSVSNSRYGLLGLLNVIRMTDPDLSTLALGKDLTSLGLNLNSPDSLHATFASPWASVPTKSRPTFSLLVATTSNLQL